MSGGALLECKAKQGFNEGPAGSTSAAFAGGDAPLSGEEAMLDASGVSSGLDSEVEDVYASWDRLLHDGGHGSSPTSAVAIVQVLNSKHFPLIRLVIMSHACESPACDSPDAAADHPALMLKHIHNEMHNIGQPFAAQAVPCILQLWRLLR